jgi:hypothetical protein
MSYFTYRHHWRYRSHGNFILTLRSKRVTCASRVFVSVTEFDADSRGGIAEEDCGHIGDARYTIHNVAPYDGGIKIWLEINSEDDLPIRTDFLVFNP